MRKGLLAEDGKAVIVALDHALASGQVAPLDAPKTLLEELLPARPDGLILTYGMMRLTSPGAVGQRWLTADYYATSTLPGSSGEHEIQDRIWSAATAKALGASGLKVLLVFGRENDAVFLRNVRYVAELIAEAAGLGLPVMVEPVLWGKGIAPEQHNEPELVVHAARVAFELGADVIKVPIPSDPKALEGITAKLPVPILLMGGPATDPAHLFRLLEGGMAAGAAGVALGRNVWQHPAPAAMVAALNLLVHQGAKASEALDVLQVGGQA